MAIEKSWDAKSPENRSLKTPATEKISSPETVLEQQRKDSEKFSPENNTSQTAAVSQRPLVKAADSYQKKRAAEIDKILEAGLNEVFLSLPVTERQTFKKKGEETVVKINQLLNQTKVHFKQVIALIRDWLKMIPGINRFFLEQEAKIKASKIIKIKDQF